MTYNKPYAVLFGGNRFKMVDGREVQEVSSDTWILNISDRVYSWLQFEGDSPSPRVYHSSAICQSGPASGMIVIFGGRDRMGQALNDTWGFRRHRSGNWDWTRPSCKAGVRFPTPRYQHSSLFVGSLLIVIGGRSNSEREDVLMEVYDTDTSDSTWRPFKCERRFRHSSWAFDNVIYNYGGFEESITTATDSISLMDL
jgi:protein phosphatase